LSEPAPAADPRALELAYRYLNRRERTVEEVRRYLSDRDLDGASVQEALQELIEQGYLDDARFARLYVQDKRELEQWGSERIRRGLQTRGIDRDLAAEALQAVEGEAGDCQRAIDLLRRRFPERPSDRRSRERALGVLVRRGFPYELANEALRLHGGGSPLGGEDG
jgi:regulatory protein